MFTRSIEDFRNQRYLTIGEFAAQLGISEQTYRRVLRRDRAIQNPTKRQIAERLGVPPHLIAELIPVFSDAYIAALTAAIDEANRSGWYAGDPLTGEPTDTIVSAICSSDEVGEQQAA
jgi:transcriptional regulator with XRE-family HTH domain